MKLVYSKLIKINNFYRHRRLVKHYKKKVKRLDKILNKKGYRQLKNQEKIELDRYWNGIGLKIDKRWNRCCTCIRKKFDLKYIPEDLFYGVIEKKNSFTDVITAYIDKNNVLLKGAGEVEVCSTISEYN